MFRPVLRTALRRQLLSPQLPVPRRTLFSARAKKSSFKSTLGRWALAGGIVYYYATSSVFADEPKFHEEDPNPVPVEDRPPSQLSSRQRKRTDIENPAKASEAGVTLLPPATEKSGLSKPHDDGEKVLAEEGLEGLAEEADTQEAFNPETGEINWDCPCLGGMAHGPCGEEFKSAFSCFIYSTEEPKGVDCIDKFKNMQTCFQKYPEIYGGELSDEEESESDSYSSETGKDQDAQKPEEIRSAATSPKVDESLVEEIVKPETQSAKSEKEEVVEGTKEGEKRE